MRKRRAGVGQNPLMGAITHPGKIWITGKRSGSKVAVAQISSAVARLLGVSSQLTPAFRRRGLFSGTECTNLTHPGCSSDVRVAAPAWSKSWILTEWNRRGCHSRRPCWRWRRLDTNPIGRCAAFGCGHERLSGGDVGAVGVDR